MSAGAKNQCNLAVDVSPREVDAGCRLSLTAHASGLREGLVQPIVIVCDGDGAERTRARLERVENGTFSTGEIIIAAPRAVGQYVWRAIVVESDAAGATCAAAADDVRFTVVPHTLDLVVWDVSPVVVAGRRLRFRADIKCSGECAMGGQTLSIHDGQGLLLARTEFTDERWPETEPIYAAEVEVSAPEAIGQYAWEITATADSLDLPHTTASQQMTVTVVPPTACVATVEVHDRHTKAPLAGARVTLEPYHGTTNGDGIAKVPVAKGPYELHAARRGYKPFSTRINIRADIFTTAALEPEPLVDRLDKS